MVAAHVLAADRLHGDDTTVPVLAAGKTVTGRVWVYTRDDAPFGGDKPAALYKYSRDRKAEHPLEHLKDYTGILQADAYGGYNGLFEATRAAGAITPAYCRVAGDVATPGPHRSGRAGLPHPVPHGGASLPTVYW
jgi:hypothetical protein